MRAASPLRLDNNGSWDAFVQFRVEIVGDCHDRSLLRFIIDYGGLAAPSLFIACANWTDKALYSW